MLDTQLRSVRGDMEQHLATRDAEVAHLTRRNAALQRSIDDSQHALQRATDDLARIRSALGDAESATMVAREQAAMEVCCCTLHRRSVLASWPLRAGSMRCRSGCCGRVSRPARACGATPSSNCGTTSPALRRPSHAAGGTCRARWMRRQLSSATRRPSFGARRPACARSTARRRPSVMYAPGPGHRAHAPQQLDERVRTAYVRIAELQEALEARADSAAHVEPTGVNTTPPSRRDVLHALYGKYIRPEDAAAAQ